MMLSEDFDICLQFLDPTPHAVDRLVSLFIGNVSLTGNSLSIRRRHDSAVFSHVK
jgi:hypothetical protein